MGNAGSMDSQQTDFRAHNVPLKLPMPEPGELEERFAIVLVVIVLDSWDIQFENGLVLAVPLLDESTEVNMKGPSGNLKDRYLPVYV